MGGEERDDSPAGHPAGRPIRSFVLRPGRMTTGQGQALERHWPAMGLAVGDGVVDLASAFPRAAPVVLEIGFGMGDSLASMALGRPEYNYIGVEVHPPGVGRLLSLCAEQGIDNVRVFREDAVQVLQAAIPEAGLEGVQLYFPDPWPKKKHHKRRLLQADFARLVASRTRAGGYFHLATDWEHYAQHMLEVMEAEPAWRNLAGPGLFSTRPQWRPITKFERRGERLGHGVWDLLYERVQH